MSTPAPVLEQRTRAADGVSLAYETAGAGEPTLVFVHGWCCERAFWRSTCTAFADRWRVVALDLGGHGASGAERERWTLEALAGDVVAVVEDVVEAVGARDVILVGHSMGAPVSLLAAPRLAPRVRGVIGVEGLHDADFAYPPGYLNGVAAELEADFPRVLERTLRGALGPGVRPEVGEWIRARALGTDRRAAIMLLRGLEGFSLAPALSSAGVPVRVINAPPRGPDGLLTAVEKNARLADYRAELMEGVGHFPMLEDPQRFQDRLARVVEELAGR